MPTTLCAAQLAARRGRAGAAARAPVGRDRRRTSAARTRRRGRAPRRGRRGRVLLAEVAQEPLPGPRAEVQRRRRSHRWLRPRRPARAMVQILVAVGDHRQHRRHSTWQGSPASLIARTSPAGPAGSVCRARGPGAASSTSASETPIDTGTSAGGVDEQRQVPPGRGALGQDRERRARVGERVDDPGHQPIAAFGTLVGIGVGAQGHRFPRPGRSPQFAGEHLGDVDLDDDLAVEVAPVSRSR